MAKISARELSLFKAMVETTGCTVDIGDNRRGPVIDLWAPKGKIFSDTGAHCRCEQIYIPEETKEEIQKTLISLIESANNLESCDRINCDICEDEE